MNKYFLPYAESLEMKLLDFDEECLAYWNADPYFKTPIFNLVKPFHHEWCIPAPLIQQTIDWLVSKGLYADASFNTIYNGKYGYKYGRISSVTSGYTPDFEGNTREEALLKAIRECIKIIKNERIPHNKS